MKNFFFLKTTIATSILLALSTTPALAEVTKITDSATLQQQQGERYFSQDGVSGEEAKPVDTAGADMDLSLAMKIIVPDSWVVKPSGSYEDAIVSWKGGLAWSNILYNIANDEEIYVNLDWIQKIVSVHVPGATQSEQKIVKSSQEKISEERDGFQKKAQKKWEQKNAEKAALARKDKQFESMIENQKKAQKANQEFIARLNDSNDTLKSNLSQLQKALEEERQKREEIEDKFAVIDPSLKSGDEKIDAVELFQEFQELWVKPFDDSFMYYKDGGHSDVITAETPATYIAKQGTIEEVVRNWAEHIGWHLEYSAGVEHNNPYEVTFKGSFIDASKELIKVFKKSNRPINIDFYPDVRVKMKDGSYRHGLVKITDLNYGR